MLAGAFELAHAGCDLEQDSQASRRAGQYREATAQRKLAAEKYSKSIEILLQIKPTISPAEGKSAQVLNEMIEVLLDRMSKILQRGPIVRKFSANNNNSVPMAIIDPAQGKFPIFSYEKRRRIAEEILQTEQTYLTQLKRLTNTYQLPYLQSAILSPEEDAICFAGLTQICELSARLLHSLEERLARWDARSTTLGDIFSLYASFLKVYIPYANNFARANAVFANKQDAGEFPPELQSLRILPIQRVPRYMLLLRELSKATSEHHPDFAKLDAALADVSNVATQINDRLKASELEAKVFEIQSSLWSATRALPELLAPGRVFKKEGPIAKYRSNGQIKRNYHLFAFNDIVVYTTTNPVFRSKYHFHNALDFYGAFPCDEEVPASKLKYGECAFKITGSNGYRVFIAPSDAVRREWLEALQNSAGEKEQRRKSWGRARELQQHAASSSSSPMLKWAADEEEEDDD